MTDAEIKEAIRRDKEWMDNLNPEDEIKIPEGGIKGLFGDDDEASADKDSEEFAAEGEPGEDEADEEETDDEEDGENDEGDDEEDGENDEGDDDDDDVDTSGVGGMLGALVGGIGGIVIGGILGTALFDD